RLLESKIAQIPADHFRKFGCRFRTQFSQSLAYSPQLCAVCRNLASQPLQLFIAPFDFSHSFSRALAKSDDFRNRRSVFSFQRFKERNPLLESGQLFGVESKVLGIATEVPRNFR